MSEASVATLRLFQYRFRHKLQTVLFIIHALTCFLIQVSEKQHFRYDRVTFCHGFDKWAFCHKKQMQYNMFSLHVFQKRFLVEYITYFEQLLYYFIEMNMFLLTSTPFLDNNSFSWACVSSPLCNTLVFVTSAACPKENR